jgi:two-component system sensor histidine kinase KdpD
VKKRQKNLRFKVGTVAISYALTFLVSLLTALFLFILEKLIHPSNAALALLFLLPVGLSAYLWGLASGIFAAFLAFLSFNFFFIAPRFSFSVHQTQDLLVLLVFLIVAIVMSQLVGRIQKNLSEAKAREIEAIRLYELSTALAGTLEENAVAQIVAERSRETFDADMVMIIVEREKAKAPLQIQSSREKPVEEDDAQTLLVPTFIAPMQSSSGVLGEIRLYRQTKPFSASEERLLRTFASQAVLALERTWLSQVETRAKVLEESDRLKSSILSSVSHELRTPLATIKASVTSLRSREVDWESSDRDELLAAIEEETDHLNQLVSNLLNMSRIEAGALQPEKRWNILAEIATNAIHRTRADQHTVVLAFPEELPLVPVDWIQMEQVFTNLLSNSIKYSPPGSIIHLSASVFEENELLIQVKNAGPHVPDDQLERIFDKFYRLIANERITGTGLGLSICKGIIEAHGGKIWAENQPDGFAFFFTIPLTLSGDRPRLPEEER